MEIGNASQIPNEPRPLSGSWPVFYNSDLIGRQIPSRILLISIDGQYRGRALPHLADAISPQ